jgi:GNAT superfamily N-acetyltransferase
MPDAHAIRGLFEELTGREVSLETVEDRLAFVRESPLDELYVYEQDGRVCAVLGFRIRENIEEQSRYGEISVMVAGAEVRRKGIGSALMTYAEALARQKGCKGTWLVSGTAREEEAHKFYQALGYAVTGYRFVKLF